MNDTVKTPVLKRLIKRLTTPLLIVGAIGTYVVISGKLGTCPACVAITDAIFGPNVEAAVQSTEPWSFPDLKGGTLSSQELEGDVTVLAFWATWCPPCRKEIPALASIQERYADKGVNVIGVSLDEFPDNELAAKVKELGITYPVVRGDQGIPELFGDIRSIPTVFIFSRDSEIAFRHVGYTSENTLEKEIRKLL